MTADDFFALGEEVKLVELIDGELVRNVMPPIRHQRVIGNLLMALAHYFRAHGGGEVWLSPLDVVLDEHNVCEPDLIVISDARASIVGERCITGAPDILIEVLSEDSRVQDEVTKRRLYERFGVTEYWIVDLTRDEVRAHRGGETALLAGPDEIASPLLPGFAFPVCDVFEA